MIRAIYPTPAVAPRGSQPPVTRATALRRASAPIMPIAQYSPWQHTDQPLRNLPGRKNCTVPQAISSATSVATSVRPSQAALDASFTKQPKEQLVEVEMEVEGSIPEWLSGSYLRNGPGDYTGMKHMFDGYALINKVRIEGGKAWAMHRFLESKAYSHFRENGKMRWREFATPVSHSNPWTVVREVGEVMLGGIGLRTGMTDNASVNVVPHPTTGLAIALSEAAVAAYEIDIETLQTLEQVDITSIPGSLTTAHPRPTRDGDIINFMSQIGVGYRVYRQKKGSFEREEIAVIPHLDGNAPAWIHDFALSENYAIIVEPPMFMSLASIVTGVETDYVFMDWKPEMPTRVHVVELKTGKVQTKFAPSFFAFHYVNAFESKDGSELYVDIAKFEDAKIMKQLSIPALRSVESPDLQPGHPERMTIRVGPDSSDTIAPKDIRRLISDGDSYGSYFEFPTVSPTKSCLPYRYAYGVCAARPTNVANALVKHDCEEGTSKSWVNSTGGIVGEPRFIPRPGATEEDDGVVMSLCIGNDGKGFAVFLDGESFEEVARAKLPYGIAYGFHGNFFRTSTE